MNSEDQEGRVSRLVYPAIKVLVRRTGRGVEVSVQTDLPDGTVIRYAVRNPGLLGSLWGARTGDGTVTGGRMDVSFEPSPWKSKRLAVTVSVLADRNQPPQTRALLGDRGEYLASDVAGHDHSEYFVSQTVDSDGPEDVSH